MFPFIVRVMSLFLFVSVTLSGTGMTRATLVSVIFGIVGILASV